MRNARTVEVVIPEMEVPTIPKVAVSVEEAAAALSIGKTLAYELINQGRLKVIRLGKKDGAFRVPVEELHNFCKRELLGATPGSQGGTQLT